MIVAVKWDCFIVCLCLEIFSDYKTIPIAAKEKRIIENNGKKGLRNYIL
jgi:hypothetical protein